MIVDKIRQKICDEYGEATLQEINLSEMMFCPETLKLPKKILTEAEYIAKDLNHLKKDVRLWSYLQSPLKNQQNSVLSSLDFHIDSGGNLKLIEVNTNASPYLFCDLLYKVKNSSNKPNNPQQKLLESFLKECHLFQESLGQVKSPPQYIAIIDENPSEQNMYPEFLLFKEIFKKQGWECDIYHFSELNYDTKKNQLLDPKGNIIDFVYNRFCDFYLSRPESQALKQAYLNNAACFSPNPQEYESLADKNRLFDFSHDDFWSLFSKEEYSFLRNSLLKTELLTTDNAGEFWQRRKKMFFKPSQSHGGKQVYKGSGISNKKFHEILPQKFVAQEFVPAPKIELNGSEFKYDLRFFIYGESIHVAVARVYQGQVTNMRTPGGGFACIDFI